MKSLEDLKRMREEALKKVEMREGGKDYRVVVGMATCGIAAGARPVFSRAVKSSFSISLRLWLCSLMF